jgi:hypothetical protein
MVDSQSLIGLMEMQADLGDYQPGCGCYVSLLIGAAA